MITDLELKLNGKILVTREELFILVSSWGRKDRFTSDDNIIIKNTELTKYSLKKLDISQIKDLSEIFKYSLFNGDVSKWDLSSCTNMNCIFENSEFNNDSLNFWNLSKVKNIDFIFYKSKFNGDISDWNVSNITTMRSAFDNCPFDGDISKWKLKKGVYCYEIFCDNKNFENKYNDGYEIPYNSERFLEWFEYNRKKISFLNITKEEIIELDDYLNNFNNKKIEIIQ